MPLIQTDKPVYFIRLDTLSWPVTEADIRAAFPNTSFPQPFVPPDGYAVVFPAPQPTYNAVTQSVRETTPVLTDKGHWEQTWDVVELFATQEERDAAIAADTEAKRLASIPASVTMRQARLALHAAGLLSGVDAAIASMQEPAKTAALIEWEYASAVERNAGLVPAMAAALGMSEADIDDLFITAATL